MVSDELTQTVYFGPAVFLECFTYISFVAKFGFDNLDPFSSRWINSSFQVIPAYGKAPRENISQKVTPNDHTSAFGENSRFFSVSIDAQGAGIPN
jgi:hypothetical protein